MSKKSKAGAAFTDDGFAMGNYLLVNKNFHFILYSKLHLTLINCIENGMTLYSIPLI